MKRDIVSDIGARNAEFIILVFQKLYWQTEANIIQYPHTRPDRAERSEWNERREAERVK
jgi:hypothetical protein